MPLDPNIPLSVRPVQAPDPYAALDYALRARQQERLEQAAQLETDRIAEERAKQQEAGQARQQLNAIMREAFKPSVDGTAPSLDRTKIQERLAASGQWHLWPSIAPHLDEVDKSAQQAKKLGEEVARLQQQAEGAKAKGMAAIAYGVHLAGDTPEALLLGAAQAKAHGWATDDDLEPYLEAAQQDPSKVPMITSQLIGLSPDYAALLTRERKPAEPGKVPDVGSFPDYAMRAAKERGVSLDKLGPADIQALRASYQASGGATEQGAKAGSFEDYVERVARERGVTPGALKAADIEQARKRYQQADDRARVVVPKQERLVQIVDESGATVWAPASEAVGKKVAATVKPPTGVERQALAFYNRARQAEEDIRSLEPAIRKMSVVRQYQLAKAPNALMTAEQQQYRQAQRAFTEARLRKESGAAIAAHEYENDARTYFSQPLDDEKTMAQKARARKAVLDGLKFTSGKAYAEHYGDQDKVEAEAAPVGGGPGLSYADYVASRKKKP